MVDSKVSALVEATSLAGTDEVYAVVAGNSRRVTAQNLIDSVSGSQTLAALADTMTYTPVDTVVGRMADWSDGGFNMRVIQPSLSWYNEGTTAIGSWLGEATNEAAARLIAGAGTDSYYHNLTDGKFYSLNATTGQTEVFRGHKAGFPEEYVVVAEASRVIIFDATELGQPMWMVFGIASGGVLYTAQVSSLAMLNGYLVVGMGGAGGSLSQVDFLSDLFFMQTGNGAGYNRRAIYDRNNQTLLPSGLQPAIVNRAVNDVAITVLPDAPIDLATGMPVPTIAVATDGGISQIGWDGNGNTDAVWDITGQVNPVTFVAFTNDNRIATNEQYNNFVAVYDILTADVSYTTYLERYLYAYTPAIWQAGSILSGDAVPMRNSVMALGRRASNSGYPGYGLELLKRNPGSYAYGMVNHLTTTYLSGWMPGDIRGSWLADTTAETITGAELVTNGTFDTDVSGWTAGRSATLSWSSGQMVVTNGAADYGYATQGFSTVAGKSYVVSVETISPPNTIDLHIGTAAGGYDILTNKAAGVYTFVATTTTTYVTLLTGDNVSGTAKTFDNVSVRLADPDRSVKGP